MKKAFVSLLTVSTIVSLVLILSTCGGSGKAGGKCMIVNGKKECSMWIEFEFRFSPKPEVLDEIFVLDLSNNFLLLDNSIPVNVTVNSDLKYKQSTSFIFTRNAARRVASVKQNFNSHVFTPQNKTAVDKFIKAALARTNHSLKARITFKFTTEGQILKSGKEIFWQKKDIGFRAKFAPDLKLIPLKMQFN